MSPAWIKDKDEVVIKMTRPCSVCEGYGRTPKFIDRGGVVRLGDKICFSCAGTGLEGGGAKFDMTIPHMDIRHTIAQEIDARFYSDVCNSCQGTGVLHTLKCWHCEGTGVKRERK